MGYYRNPILPGFHPDPSICRVNRDYYLVTSSFEFFPGVPLFHSEDLIHWEQIGHVLTRESQLVLEKCPVSGGIWAPTIRYNKGRFYVTTTNFSHGGNFIVWTDDIDGEWSDPIWIKQKGIDPSLFFDDDGTVYFVSTYDMPDGQAIGQCIIDIETGNMLTETKIIWNGSGGKYPEGPHMFRKNGIYYLMIAEGGTEYGHMETIARSSSPWGPFIGCPRNPILTHRDTRLEEFQALGHADLVVTPEGDSWMIFHGIRTSQYMLHHLGRETMIAPVSWVEDGWPLVYGGKNITPIMEVLDIPDEKFVTKIQGPDLIESLFLDKYWSFLRNPDMKSYSLSERPGSICLIGSKVSLNDCASPTFIGRRQQHFNLQAKTIVDYLPKKDNDMAGMTIFHTNEHHYDLAIRLCNGKRVAILRKRVGDMQTESNPVVLPEEGKIILYIIAQKLEYSFFVGTEVMERVQVGTGRTQLLSTECMPMTFTGCFIGLFSEGQSKAWFEKFNYTPN